MFVVCCNKPSNMARNNTNEDIVSGQLRGDGIQTPVPLVYEMQPGNRFSDWSREYIKYAQMTFESFLKALKNVLNSSKICQNTQVGNQVPY